MEITNSPFRVFIRNPEHGHQPQRRCGEKRFERANSQTLLCIFQVFNVLIELKVVSKRAENGQQLFSLQAHATRGVGDKELKHLLLRQQRKNKETGFQSSLEESDSNLSMNGQVDIE